LKRIFVTFRNNPNEFWGFLSWYQHGCWLVHPRLNAIPITKKLHPTKKKEKETSHTKYFKGGKKKKFIKKGGNCRTQNPQ
jgi:hypothetical protein